MTNSPVWTVATLASLAMLFPFSASAQSLNQAVAQQLEVSGPGPDECALLLGNDDEDDLVGELQNICTRGIPNSGAGSSSSAGGGAATPAMLPGVIEDRMGRGTDSPDAGSASPAQASMSVGDRGGIFFSAGYEDLDRDVTTFEDGYDSELVRLTAGGDYRFSDRFLAGIAFDGHGHYGDFQQGGDFEDYAVGVLAYGSVTPTDSTAIDVNAGYSHGFYDRQRVASFTQLDSGGAPDFTRSGFTRADYDSESVHAAALVSHDLVAGALTFSPHVGVEFRHVEFDSYTETGNTGLELSFRRDDQTWLQSRVGATVTGAISTPFGVVIPQISFDWKHEFENDQRNVEVSFAGDTRGKTFRYETEDPDRDFFQHGYGASLVLGGGLQAFVEYRGLLGHSFFDSHAVSAGVRKDF